MKRAAVALAALLMASPALADDDCKHVAIEVTIEASRLPVTTTVIEHECIRSNTVPVIVPLDPVGSNFRWWFQFPAERGVAVIYTGVVPVPIRVLAILNRVEVES